ncbi:MAG: HPr family phosphocarrier protein [Planctomycetota bacterium]
MIEREVTVLNANGLHARPAMQVVECANAFESDVTIVRPKGDDEAGIEDGAEADAGSVMQVITLAAQKGTVLVLKVEGPDEADAVESLCALFDSKFGEDG